MGHFGACANFGAHFLGPGWSDRAKFWWEAELHVVLRTKKFRAPSVEKKVDLGGARVGAPKWGRGARKNFAVRGYPFWP